MNAGSKACRGISNDVRDLLASKDPRAELTLDYFAYRISLYAGMLAAAMGGIDGFVFTAGIGENAPAIREAVAGRLAWLGLDFDRELNASGKMVISRSSSCVACYVIPKHPDSPWKSPSRTPGIRKRILACLCPLFRK